MKPHEEEIAELGLLRDEVHRLEQRVYALEHKGEARAPLTAHLAGAPDVPSFALPNVIPVAGRATLGLAGAYLLRALSESGSVPQLLVVCGAILYAAAWIVLSVRARQEKAIAGATYGITAALILAPLLWEATVRFNVLTPSATAAILLAFIVLSSALTWSDKPGAVSAITILTALLTALALMVRTGDLVPFALALLGIAVIVEAGVCIGHTSPMRVPVAIACDLAVALVLYIMTRPGGVPEGYQPARLIVSLALCALLFLIYAAGAVWQTVIRERNISGIEIAQTVVVFALAAGGALQLTEGAAAGLVGSLAAIFCAACYFLAFLRFDGLPRRNHYVFASWGAALGLIACFLILPGIQLTLVWSAAALVATLVGTRASLPALDVHGAFYLLAAALVSGLPAVVLNAFTGDVLAPATAALWIVAIAALGCYAECFYAASEGATAKISLIPAVAAALSAGALLLLVAIPLFGPHPSVSLLATARTLVTCLVALGFGFAGSRTGHRELVWISYAAIALGTVKLLLEDFRQSHPAALALSLLCYGALLILVPKLATKTPLTNWNSPRSAP